MKLEYICNKGIFLAPKVYVFINDKGDKIIKVKGIKKDVVDTLSIDDL